jgi:hypothetical protein
MRKLTKKCGKAQHASHAQITKDISPTSLHTKLTNCFRKSEKYTLIISVLSMVLTERTTLATARVPCSAVVGPIKQLFDNLIISN